MVGLNLRELLCGDITRLRYVIRYSTCQRLHSENVAEHSYYTALYAMFITHWHNDQMVDIRQDTINIADVLRRALLHDIEECVTGDIPRGFKHYSEEVNEQLEIGANKVVRQIIGKITHEVGYIREWENAKVGPAGKIVKFADFLSVLSYMANELTNNRTMSSNWSTMNEYFADFSGEEYDFIRPLINESGVILRETFARVQEDK